MTRYIPTLAMARDPRLRRLFATVGAALAEDAVWDEGAADDLRDILLDLAPEFLPPDATDDVDRDDWERMVHVARSQR